MSARDASPGAPEGRPTDAVAAAERTDADAGTARRIALFLPSLADGGAERVMLNIALGLNERADTDVEMVLVGAHGPYLEQARRGGVRIVDLGGRRIIAALPALVRYLRERRPQAVLSALDTTNLVLLWAARIAGSRARIVVSEHCNFSSALRGAKNFRARLLPSLVSRCYRWSDEIVAVSAGVADDLAESTGLPRESMTVVVNPVVTPTVIERARAKADHPWLAEGQPPVVLGIGRLTYQKNFSLLLDAFAVVARERPARLIILGDGEERGELLERAVALGLEDRVDLPGFVQNPYAFMSRAAAFVLSSRYEGLPTVLIEALYCGARIVSTDCPSGPREILRDGALGELVAVGDERGLAAAIAEALESPRAAVPAEELDPYRLDVVVERYARLLLGD